MVQFNPLMVRNIAPNAIHANAISFMGYGILITGASGSGKSDLSLRLMDQGAILISDDYVMLTVHQDQSLWASPPEALAGKMEIRGIGIVTVPFVTNQQINLVMTLTHSYERLPHKKIFIYQNATVREFLIDPFEQSVICKIKHIIRLLL